MIAACLFGIASAAPTRAQLPPDFHPTVIDWHLSPRRITDSCSARIAVARSAVAALAAARGKRTFANTILAFENINA
ncbi:MAG: hypothetical protein M3N13_00775, partial [Candidatus Eremiobacteraeota bacterium]|nr:hypothetical protein [Candidatus Eremiobacteraeota bacterium]